MKVIRVGINNLHWCGLACSQPSPVTALWAHSTNLIGKPYFRFSTSEMFSFSLFISFVIELKFEFPNGCNTNWKSSVLRMLHARITFEYTSGVLCWVVNVLSCCSNPSLLCAETIPNECKSISGDEAQMKHFLH